ncbi:MAG: hypothetical protein Q8P95_02695 [bacterium]|nr:hypothetical protein [bacterium]
MNTSSNIPVTIKKKLETEPVEINLHHRQVDRRNFNQDQVSLDKIVEDSDSSFYITGKTTKIGLLNFLRLIDKHDINEVDGLPEQELVVSSDLITRIATATVLDEEEEDGKYIDAVAIGIFLAALFLSGLTLLTQTLADVQSFAWILLVLSGAFIVYYSYKGAKSGTLKRVVRVCIKSLSKK